MGVRQESRGPVGLLRLEEPARRNALTPETVDALEAALAALDHDPAIRVVVVSGAGGDFSAGADLRTVAQVAATEGMAFSRRMQRVTTLLADLRPVTIAALEGWVLGAGLELALAADLRVAATDARLGVPEVRYGLLPAAGGTVLLVDVLGRAMALRLLLTGEAVAAPQFPPGVIARLTAPGEAEATAVGLAHQLADLPAGAQAAAKRLLMDAGADRAGRLNRESEVFQDLLADPAVGRRLAAFLNRRGRGRRSAASPPGANSPGALQP